MSLPTRTGCFTWAGNLVLPVILNRGVTVDGVLISSFVFQVPGGLVHTIIHLLLHLIPLRIQTIAPGDVYIFSDLKLN